MRARTTPGKTRRLLCLMEPSIYQSDQRVFANPRREAGRSGSCPLLVMEVWGPFWDDKEEERSPVRPVCLVPSEECGRDRTTSASRSRSPVMGARKGSESLSSPGCGEYELPSRKKGPELAQASPKTP
jgi:hypothetical protein